MPYRSHECCVNIFSISMLAWSVARLIPRPLPVFQCCTLKNERAWEMKSREKRHWHVINNERGRWNVAVATWPAADTVVQCCYIL